MNSVPIGTDTRSRAWLVYLSVMALAATAYLVGPLAHSGPFYNVIGASCPIAIVLGARMHKPASRLPWYAFALGQAVFIAGDVLAYNYRPLFGEELPFPSVADGLYIGFYPLVIVGVLLLIRQRYLTRDWGSLIDASVVAVSLGALSWLYLMAPWAHDASLSLWAKVVSVAYPMMDVLVLGVVVRLAVGAGYRGPAFGMLTAGFAALLVTDSIYSWLLLHGGYETGGLLDLGWAVFYALLGAAALHPSMRDLARPAPDPDARLTAVRLVALTGAILAAPAAVIARAVLDQPTETGVLMATSAVVFLLVVLRMAGLVRRNEEIGAREVALRTASESLVTARTPQQIRSAAITAARALIAQDASVRLYLAGAPAGGLVPTEATDRPVATVQAIPAHRLPPHLGAADGPRRVAHRRGNGWVVPDGPEGPDLEYLSPLFVRDELLGLLVVFPDQPLSPAVTKSLGVLTAQVGLALESAALAEDVLRQRSDARLSVLVERASDVICVIGANGVVQYASPSATRVLGRTPESLIGATLAASFAADGDEGLLTFVGEIAGFAPGGMAATETRLRHANGTWLDVEATGTNLLAEPSVAGIVLVVRDVSERTRTQRELVAAHAQAVEASRLKSEFVANMSHEIRTPLNAVIGLSGLLRDTELDEDQAGYIDAVRTSADALMTLIDDVLDFSKIEADKLELEQHPFELRAVVADVSASLGHAAEAKGLRLSTDVDESLPARIIGDSTRLRQVLSNLVSNAVKFTAAGEVSIRVSGSPGNPVTLRFEVTDTGIGLEAGAFDRIFDSFSQADGSTTRRYGGTGLGLAICKRLVLLMGGEIGGTSVLGAGSTFWFTVPAQVAEGTSAAGRLLPRQATRPTPARALMTGRHVLLVEDNPVNQLVASRMLEQRGCRVDVAANGLEALEMSVQHQYDLIFMDCQMPELDGYRTTSRIREREGDGPRTPIIAMTAHALKGDRERCLEAGMDEYLTKPVRAHELDELMLRLTSSQEDADADADADSDSDSDAELALFDPGVLQSSGVDSDELRAELLTMFVEQSRDHLAQIGAAVADGDAEAVQRLAHSWKGSSALMGAVRLAAVCERLCASAVAGESNRLVDLHADAERVFQQTLDALHVSA